MDILIHLLEDPLAWKEDKRQIVEDTATNVLITHDGKCNWMNIRYLQWCGYDVFAGEKDSFGWLGGVIKRSDGIKFNFG